MRGLTHDDIPWISSLVSGKSSKQSLETLGFNKQVYYHRKRASFQPQYM